MWKKIEDRGEEGAKSLTRIHRSQVVLALVAVSSPLGLVSCFITGETEAHRVNLPAVSELGRSNSNSRTWLCDGWFDFSMLA